MASEWCQSSMHSWLLQGQEKAATKSTPAILQGNSYRVQIESALD